MFTTCAYICVFNAVEAHCYVGSMEVGETLVQWRYIAEIKQDRMFRPQRPSSAAKTEQLMKASVAETSCLCLFSATSIAPKF